MVFHRLCILYGTETGNSEDVAKRMFLQSKKRKIPVKIDSLNYYPLSNLIQETLVVFICSTTGQGQVPSSMKKFWSLIMKRSLPNDIFSSLTIAVIGLGDSSYSKYNIVSKKLFSRLKQLGASIFMDIVLGDDQHDLGYGAAIDPWLEKFWSKLEYTFDTSFLPISKDDLSTKLFTLSRSPFDINESKFPVSDIYDETNPFIAYVISNYRITHSDHFQNVRFLKLQIPSSVKYKIGDIAMICPQNLYEDIQKFISLLELNPDDRIFIKKEDKENFEHSPYNYVQSLTISELVTRYLDIHSVPKRSFFELFWKFSDDSIEKEKLKEFASTEGQFELYTYCYRPHRTILEVLIDFPKTAKNIPVEFLADLIPIIRPRPFSIASSNLLHSQEIHLLVAVVNYKTSLKANRLGLCSNYIDRMNEGDKVSLWIRQGEYKIPDGPLIMIGPGTGVAPFRGIIEERILNKIIDNYLFFGCRYKEKDFYFQEEWNLYCHKNEMKLFTAFSRDQEDKEYVQHSLWKERNLVWSLIKKNACFLIAGNAKDMPQDVRNMLKKIIENFECIDSESFISKLEKISKIQYECWS